MTPKKLKLSEVFGVSTDIPQYTYVDRQNLDEKFEHYLGSQKHIVIHGASKQGKTCLRKKNTNLTNSIVVQCLPSMQSADELWASALHQMGIKEIVTVTAEKKSETALGGGLDSKVSALIFGSVSAKVDASVTDSENEVREEEAIRAQSNLPRLAESLRSSNIHLTLEDFHYLPEVVRKEVAFGLKALYEEKAYVIIIGIWSEQNLITYYNGDLTGRIEEFDLVWNGAELGDVLAKGEGALNIEFAPGLKSQMIEACFGNVGLLQRLAEKICLEEGIFETQPEKKVISNVGSLKSAKDHIIKDTRQRYIRIAAAFREGLKTGSILHLYARVYNEIIRAADDELIDSGISVSDLLTRIQKAAKVQIRASDLTQVLDRIEKLQASRHITPLLISYSKSVKKVFLNDREFLFYRKFSGDNPEDITIDIEEKDNGTPRQ